MKVAIVTVIEGDIPMDEVVSLTGVIEEHFKASTAKGGSSIRLDLKEKMDFMELVAAARKGAIDTLNRVKAGAGDHVRIGFEVKL